MAFPVDINRCVVLGVEEVIHNSSDLRWLLFGWHLDSWFGFGGGQAESGYQGEVAIISKRSKITKFLEIDRCRYRMGFWGWAVETKDLPDPPFLITNKLNTQLTFDGTVELELNEEGKKLFFERRNFAWQEIPISFLVLGSSDWFGKVTKLDQENLFHLLVYSDSGKQESILDSEIIANYDVANAIDELMVGEEITVEQFKPFAKVTRLFS
jgi:hypothetical protein